jgi:hypothetical protein
VQPNAAFSSFSVIQAAGKTGRLDMPVFALCPRRLGDQPQGLMAQQDLDFEHQPRFSMAYVLQSPDEAQIRALFRGEKPASFSQQPGLCIENHSRRGLCYRTLKRVFPKAIPAFLGEGLVALHLLTGGKAAPSAEKRDSLAGLDKLLAKIDSHPPSERIAASAFDLDARSFGAVIQTTPVKPAGIAPLSLSSVVYLPRSTVQEQQRF